ncbi:hypothetical protein AT746_09110 [Lacimicrobium alkaliphilum]|uniref:1,4-dihydroxy-2-naphthoate octaprenyltransferase n=1 Tax=Lacimicrobium alkaliphilum TaxID=1526571 RepID=A0A0U3AWD8_9ALTE|nr:hypothetical protein AT746_09110 [Lacimicrobium alkaliphilum]
MFGHISVNCLNEYQDFRSGLDFKTIKTPFSGGSGALPEHPQAAPAVLVMAVVSLVLCVSLGLYLVNGMGWLAYGMGLLAVTLILSYTRWLNRMPLVCLMAPGTGFGIVMVTGSIYVLTGRLELFGLVVSLLPFFLVNNLLLVNQYPDIKADREHGRRTAPGHYGTKASNRIYAFFSLCCGLTLIVVLLMAQGRGWSWLLMLPLLLNIKVLSGLVRENYQAAGFQKTMALNVMVTLLVPVLTGLWLIGRG